MTISKERRDEIRAYIMELRAAGRKVAGVFGQDDILALLDALDAAEEDDADEAYDIGLRDGYEKAVQEIDVATGGDGEFKGSTFPGETVDVPVMRKRIIDRLDAAEKAEPVAWMYPDGRAGHAVTMDRKVACDAFPGIANPVPLYTHPAPAVREGWKPLTENVVGPVLVCRFGDEDHNWLPLTAYRVTGGKWERPASRDGLPYEPTHWQRLPTAAPEAK